jgi:hypothetical protein
VAHYLNREYKDIVTDAKYGTAFQQICASNGLVTVGKENPFGLKSPTVHDILEGTVQVASPVNSTGRSTPYGTEARTLFPAAVIALIEDAIQPDRVTDNADFRSMIALNQSIDTENFMQPVISFAGAGGANTATNGARAQRITQMSNTPMMLRLTTSERQRTLATYGIGLEMSEQAMRASTLDLVAMTVKRYMDIEHDQRVYTYLSNIFAGDSDHNTGAVSAVTAVSLDSASTTMANFSHKAWVKFLARNRKKRKITHVVADIDTYLAVESRVGRPGTNNYDPTLARIDPQARMMNNTFGGDVQWFLVDSAAAGGPVPANTVWALDKAQGIMMVNNVAANYQATQEFVLTRKSAMVFHWGEEAFRLWGDTDLTPFDVLTIA